MTSFVLVEGAILLGPLLAFVAERQSPKRARVALLVLAGGGAVLLAAAGNNGFRLVPPLAAVPLALGILAFWMIVAEARPDPEAPRSRKVRYWVPVGLALCLDYLIGTVGVLGVGFATAGLEPEGRHELGSGIVAQATYLGGPGLDYNGWEVEIRRTIPVVRVFERVVARRSYLWDQATGREPPSFDTASVGGSSAIVVRLSRGGDPDHPNPDTLRLGRS